MPMDLMGEKEFQVLSGSNNDIVFLTIDIPAGCILKKVDLQGEIIGQAAANERENALAYAMAGYIIPVEDPDTRVTPDVLWDRFVPKYTEVDLIDLDTTTAVTTPFYEPGEGSFEDLYDMGNTPLKVWSRKKRLNFADPGSLGLRFQPAETPFESQWIPCDRFRMRINKGIKVKRPSVLSVAIASPAYDRTQTVENQLTEQTWGQIQYAEATLERALMNQLALTEATAETPWEEASVILRQYLSPDVHERTAATFLTEQFNVFGFCTYTVNVPGTMSFDKVDLTPI